MERSKFIAKILGIYLLIISIAMLIHMHQFSSLISSLINNESLMFIIGCFTLILGLLIIISHNVWQWNWRVLVTIVGWCAFLKGLSIILFPYAVDQLSILFIQNLSFEYIAACIDLTLGLVLTYFGFKK